MQPHQQANALTNELLPQTNCKTATSTSVTAKAKNMGWFIADTAVVQLHWQQ